MQRGRAAAERDRTRQTGLRCAAPGLGLLSHAVTSQKSPRLAALWEQPRRVCRGDGQHVVAYSQLSWSVCLQPDEGKPISSGPLNGTYKLIAKWLKSLVCCLSMSLWEALCCSSVRPAPLSPANHWAPEALQPATALSQRKTPALHGINYKWLFR